jgi:hypothetical protein
MEELVMLLKSNWSNSAAFACEEKTKAAIAPERALLHRERFAF